MKKKLTKEELIEKIIENSKSFLTSEDDLAFYAKYISALSYYNLQDIYENQVQSKKIK